MRTNISFDWQVFEDSEWEAAVASGVLAGGGAGHPATPTTPGAGHVPHLPWFSLAGIAPVVVFLWLVYAPWSARRAEAMPLTDVYGALTALVEIKARDGSLHFAAVDPATRTPQRLTLLSDYFRFTYDPHDRGAVIAAAAMIDPLPRALRRMVGLGEAAGLIHIGVNPQARASEWRMSGGVLTPSSDFLHVPFESAGETLFQSLQQPLTNAVLTEALGQSPVRPQWNLLVDGLRRWLQTCFDAQYGAQCADDWPVENALAAGEQVQLADLIFTGPDWVSATPRAKRIADATSLVAYVVATYGADKLPVLIDGLRQHDGWQTLIPALFDRSAEQFEQEWLASYSK
jgi:hypothetical protein